MPTFDAFLSDSDDEAEALRITEQIKSSAAQQKKYKKQANDLKELALGGAKKTKKIKNKKKKKKNTQQHQQSEVTYESASKTNNAETDERMNKDALSAPGRLDSSDPESKQLKTASSTLQPEQPPRPPQLAMQQPPLEAEPQLQAPAAINLQLMQENSQLRALLAEQQQQYQLLLGRYQELERYVHTAQQSAAPPAQLQLDPGQQLLQMIQRSGMQEEHTLSEMKLTYSAQRLRTLQERCTALPSDLPPFYPLQLLGGDGYKKEDGPVSSSVSIVAATLTKCKVPAKVAKEYAKVFVEEGFASEDAINTLTQQDMEVMAIKKGHIRLILKAINQSECSC
jgi:hypothetical protein